MKETKLLKLLSVLDKSEMKELKQAVISPYFNATKPIVKLYEFVQSQHPNFEEDKCTPERCYKYIFPKDKYDETALAKLSSKLLKIVERHLLIKEMEDDSPSDAIYLLRFYAKRGLYKHLESQYKTVQKELTNIALRNSEFFLKSWLLEANYNIARNHIDKLPPSYQEISTYLDNFYFSCKLELLSLMITDESVNQRNYNFSFKDELLEYLSKKDFSHTPAIQLQYFNLQLIIQPSEAIYQIVKKLLYENSQHFTLIENRNFFTYLENAARIIFTEPAQYFKELFVLYQEQLAKRIPYTDGHLSVMYFRNVITVALMNKDTKWAEQFLIDNKDSIRDIKDDVWNLCQAQVLFAKGDYDGAIDALNTAYFTNIYFKLDDRQLRLKVYYELNEIDVLDSFINSYKKFLFDNTDKIEERVLNGHRSFLAIVSKLLSLPYHSPPEREKLYTQFKEAGAMPNKHWLEEKIKAKLA